MPAGMFLKSEGFASSLSDPQRRYGLPAYCRDRGVDHTAPISLETFTRYGIWFQQELVPELEEVDVTQLSRTGHEFELRLGSGTRVTAQQVVLAVGVGHFASIPSILAGLPHRLVSHTSDHHDLTRFSGQDVTVIGGGQSALETAALLRENGALVRVVVRKPDVRFHRPPDGRRRSLAARLRAPTAGLGSGWVCWTLEHGPAGIHFLPAATRVRLVRQILGPCGAWWLKERVVGRFEMMTSCTMLSAIDDGDRVRLALRQEGHGEREVRTNHIVAGTGYHVDLRRLRFLSPELLTQIRELDGSPVLSRHFESSVPGLYFGGLAAAYSFGPLLRFVLGVHFAAPTIAEGVAKRLKQDRRSGELPASTQADTLAEASRS